MKSQGTQAVWDCSTLEDGTDRLSSLFCSIICVTLPLKCGCERSVIEDILELQVCMRRIVEEVQIINDGPSCPHLRYVKCINVENRRAEISF